jgi:pyrroline-5-carboxylate reductase
MRIGLIGAGNMARALARGWGEPVLCSDAGSGRARALVDEMGGTAFATNLEVAERADLVVLCHKPQQLTRVAREIGGVAKVIASVVGGTSIGRLQAAYPGTPVFALMPNTPVEVRRGVILLAEPPEAEAGTAAMPDPQIASQVLDLFARLGALVRLPEHLLPAAAALMSVGPAYQALVAEAQVDAGVRRGLSAPLAGRLVVETMAGTAALLDRRAHDTLAVRREVTSPGGTTARGLAALEAGGVRSAFNDAIDAVLDGGGRHQ